MPTAIARRIDDPYASHRARTPGERGNAANHLLAPVPPTIPEAFLAPHAFDGPGDHEPTSVRELPELCPTRPSQDFEPTRQKASAQKLAGAQALVPQAPAVAPAPQPAQAPVALAPGSRAGRYELRDKLGMGTFGLVFKARDLELERDVALKILNPAHATNRDLLQRFLQEARASARIHHPGIVTVFDSGRIQTSSGETAFIAMELLAGESLTHRLSRSGRMAPDVACEIARQVASALDAAHRADVLHRDLKPDNIYLVPDPAVPSGERVKVLDFGLAKLGGSGQTLANTIFGTPRYMSPEQCRSSGQIDQRSDVYALGCVLFELVTGRPPFSGDLRQLIERHQRAAPPRARSFAPEVSEALDELIARMLAKDPAARPQTMGALQRALEGIGGIAIGVAETMLPMPGHLIGLPVAPPPARPSGLAFGSGPRAFDPAVSGEVLVPAHLLQPPQRNPALMLPPEGRRGRGRGLAIATVVAVVVAGLLMAIATREPAEVGTAAPPAAAQARPAR